MVYWLFIAPISLKSRVWKIKHKPVSNAVTFNYLKMQCYISFGSSENTLVSKMVKTTHHFRLSHCLTLQRRVEALILVSSIPDGSWLLMFSNNLVSNGNNICNKYNILCILWLISCMFSVFHVLHWKTGLYHEVILEQEVNNSWQTWNLVMANVNICTQT